MKNKPQNREMAQDVLDYIAANPDKHDQFEFIVDPDQTGCGTTMCIAGTAAWLAYGPAATVIPEVKARELLGLSFGEAEALFYEFDNARAIAKLRKVANGEGFVREDYYCASDGELEFDSSAYNMRDYYGDE